MLFCSVVMSHVTLLLLPITLRRRRESTPGNNPNHGVQQSQVNVFFYESLLAGFTVPDPDLFHIIMFVS